MNDTPINNRAPKKGNSSHTTRLAHAFKRESGHPYMRAKEIVERAARAGLLPEPIDVDEMRPALEVLRRLDRGDQAVRSTVPDAEPCHAARTGEGYWTCDVPGGCDDCRALATEIDDTDQLAAWAEEAAAPAPRPPVMSAHYGISSHAVVLSGPSTGSLPDGETGRLRAAWCDVCDRSMAREEPYWFVGDTGRPADAAWENGTGVVCARHLPDYARHRRFTGPVFDQAASATLAVPFDFDSSEEVEKRVAKDGNYLLGSWLGVLRDVERGLVTLARRPDRRSGGSTLEWQTSSAPSASGDALILTLLEDGGYLTLPVLGPDDEYGTPRITGYGYRVLAANAEKASRPKRRTPYVGTGADGARRSAQIDLNERDTLPTGPHDPHWTEQTAERYADLTASAQAWEAQATLLEAEASDGEGSGAAAQAGPVEKPPIDPWVLLEVGDQVRFMPRGGSGQRWWTVRARDERFIVATVPAPFEEKGTVWYTVVDLTGWLNKRYNGAGHGVVRSSLNTLGGGWDIDADGNGCEEILDGLRSGKWELSHRRVTNVERFEKRG